MMHPSNDNDNNNENQNENDGNNENKNEVKRKSKGPKKEKKKRRKQQQQQQQQQRQDHAFGLFSSTITSHVGTGSGSGTGTGTGVGAESVVVDGIEFTAADAAQQQFQERFPLAVALKEKDAFRTRQLLQSRTADPNQALPPKGQRPLYIAAFTGFTKGMEILLEFGADPNLPNEVLDDDDEEGIKAVAVAAAAEATATTTAETDDHHLQSEVLNVNIVATISGTTLGGETPLYGAATNDQYGTGDIDIGQSQHQQNQQRRQRELESSPQAPQEHASSIPPRSTLETFEDGFTAGIRLLLDHGADPNKETKITGETPLYGAAVHGDEHSMKVLLLRGADPNKTTRLNDDRTPLYGAAAAGQRNCLQLLLQSRKYLRLHGSEERQTRVNANRSGGILSLCCSRGGISKNVRIDVNKATYKRNETPLYAAAANGHYICVKYLVYQGGADWNKPNVDGLTPLCIAAKYADRNYVKNLILGNYKKDYGHEDDDNSSSSSSSSSSGSSSDDENSDNDFKSDHGSDSSSRKPKDDDSAQESNTSVILGVGGDKRNYEECVKLLVERGEPNPLKRAVELADTELVDIILTQNSKREKNALISLTVSMRNFNNNNNNITATKDPLTAAALAKLDVTFFNDPNFVLFKSSNKAFMLYLLSRDDLPWKAKQAILERGMKEVNDEKEILAYLHASLKHLSAKSIEHKTIFLVMSDFYFYCWWIAMFAITTFNALPSSENGDYRANGDGDITENKKIIAIYIMIAVTLYFMIREMFELIQSGYGYVQDYWNWVNMISIALVLSTAIGFLEGLSLTLEGPEHKQFQKIVMSAGAFLCLSFVGYLKVTILAFSNFVGGVAQIMVDLLPFAIVTSIVLYAFTFMYYIQQYGSKGYETFAASFYTIFTQFVGGLEGTTGALDIIFGIISVVILLNVVIAIVSTSWENAVDTSLILLCQYRLELLRQVDAFTPAKGFSKKYNLIPKDYDEDYHKWIESRILSVLRPDFEGEAWWYLELSEEERRMWKWEKTLWNILSGPLKAILEVIPWILGFFTFGLLWPKHIREFLFGIVSDVNETDSNDWNPVAQNRAAKAGKRNADQIAQIRKDTKNMEQAIIDLRREIVSRSSDVIDTNKQLIMDQSIEKRMERIEQRMEQVNGDIKMIKQTNQDILQLLMVQSGRSLGPRISESEEA